MRIVPLKIIKNTFNSSNDIWIVYTFKSNNSYHSGKKADDPQARAAILETVTKLACPFGHHERVYLPNVKDLKAHVKVTENLSCFSYPSCCEGI